VISIVKEEVALGIVIGGSLVHSNPNVQSSKAGEIAGETVYIDADAAEHELSAMKEEKPAGVVYETV
jgi:hypothetical protein